MYQVIEAYRHTGGVKTEAVGEFDTEEQAVSYALGQQQVHRESKHLWFVRQQDEAPVWVVDEDGLRRKPTTEELDTFFAS